MDKKYQAETTGLYTKSEWQYHITNSDNKWKYRIIIPNLLLIINAKHKYQQQMQSTNIISKW